MTGIPSIASSKVVSLAPCCLGRVSSAKTFIVLSLAKAERTTPRAVPYPPVARAPALQCVNIVAPLGTTSAPKSPIFLHLSISSYSISIAF